MPNVLSHPDHRMTVIPGLDSDRGCPRCKRKMDPESSSRDLFIVDARGRYWCHECVVLTLGQHTRIEEDRPGARYTWDFPLAYAHGCSADHDPGIACKHGAACVDCMPHVCRKKSYEWWKNRSDPQ